jgi:hypothetical protein
MICSSTGRACAFATVFLAEDRIIMNHWRPGRSPPKDPELPDQSGSHGFQTLKGIRFSGRILGAHNDTHFSSQRNQRPCRGRDVHCALAHTCRTTQPQGW